MNLLKFFNFHEIDQLYNFEFCRLTFFTFISIKLSMDKNL